MEINYFRSLLTFHYFSLAKISLCSGNLPRDFLEKISLPSFTTSKTPPPEGINFIFAPGKFFSMPDFKPEALGS
jgi:hypothetical protein